MITFWTASTWQSLAYRQYVLNAIRQQVRFEQVREIACQKSRLQRGFADAGDYLCQSQDIEQLVIQIRATSTARNDGWLVLFSCCSNIT